MVLYRARRFSDAGRYRRDFSPISVAGRLSPCLKPLGAHTCHVVVVLPRSVDAGGSLLAVLMLLGGRGVDAARRGSGSLDCSFKFT